MEMRLEVVEPFGRHDAHSYETLLDRGRPTKPAQAGNGHVFVLKEQRIGCSIHADINTRRKPLVVV